MSTLILQRLNLFRYLSDLGRDLVVYAFSEGFLKCFGLLSVLIFTRLLSPDTFGLFATIQAIIGFLFPLMSLGMDCAYNRIFFDYSSDEERTLATTSAFFFSVIWMSLFNIVILFISPWISLYTTGSVENSSLFFYASVGAATNTFVLLSLQPLRNQFQTGMFAFSQAIFAASSLGLSTLLLVYFNWGIKGVILGPVFAAILTQPLRFYCCRHLLSLRVSRKMIREMLKFGIPLVPTSISYWVFTSSDRFVISRFAPLTDVAYYSVASTLLGVVTLIIVVIGNAWSPHALNAYKESSEKQASRYYGQALMNIVGTLGFCCFLNILFSPELITLISGTQYHKATSVIFPLALAAIANGSTQVTAIGISLSKKTHFLFYYSLVAALINLVLNLLFVPYFGMVAAAWTTAFAYVFLTCCYYLQSQRFLPFLFDKKLLLILTTVVIGFAFLADQLSTSPLLLKATAIVAFITLLYATSINPINLMLKEGN